MTELELKDAHYWQQFIFGIFDQPTILSHVKDTVWQRTRVSMLGTTLSVKYETLYAYLLQENNSPHAQICVTNYVNALKRGGLIK